VQPEQLFYFIDPHITLAEWMRIPEYAALLGWPREHYRQHQAGALESCWDGTVLQNHVSSQALRLQLPVSLNHPYHHAADVAVSCTLDGFRLFKRAPGSGTALVLTVLNLPSVLRSNVDLTIVAGLCDIKIKADAAMQILVNC